MDHQQQFMRILQKEKESELLPFFQSMSEKERDNFIPFLRDVCKEYLEYVQNNLKIGSYVFKRKASDNQAAMLSIAALICFNEKDFRKWTSPWHMSATEVANVLSWHCPKWFNKYINSFGDDDFTPMFISYDWVMGIAEKQLLTPTKELIVKVLPQALFEQTLDHKYITRPENMLKRSITLNEHIWYFFETESNIYMSDRYLRFVDGTKTKVSHWMQVLANFAAQGKIDRHRMLKECMLATARNFNKPLAGWFSDLFTALEPQRDELLSMQEEILNALNSKHSKPVGTALTALKTIADNDDFRVASFLESTPLLLSSETKTIINSTLSILEKIAKRAKDRHEEVCMAACQAFVHADDNIQSKASKLILTYGDPQFAELSATLANYRESLLMNTKKVLSAFLTSELINDGSHSQQIESTEMHRHRDEIPLIHSFDELIFLASQAFDNNKPYHIDTLPAALISMQGEMQGANVAKLEPALQRAYKLLTGGFVSTTGYLDHLLATFFIDFTHLVIGQRASEAQALIALHESFARQEAEFKITAGKYYFRRIFPLKEWRTQNRDVVYQPYKDLLLLTLAKLKARDSLPLLSTPTHEPALISPEILIERIQLYEQKRAQPDLTDLQIAISRCDLSGSENGIALPDQSLKSEAGEILRYLLTPGSRPQTPVNMPAAWIAASVTRDKTVPEALQSLLTAESLKHVTGQFPWVSSTKGRLVDRYNYIKGKYEKVKSDQKTLQILFEDDNDENRSLKKLFSNFSFGRHETVATLYDVLKLNPTPFGIHENDIGRLMYLTPQHPEPLLAQVISNAMTYNTFSQANHQKLVVNAAEALMALRARLGQTGHLFIATCMLSVDKTIQSFAAETWSQGAQQKHVDSRLLGEIIGKHQSIEFAPLRRLTDLIGQSMMDTSSFHNQELEKLIAEILVMLPREPVNNLRKLLELYHQVLSVNGSVVAENVKQQLTAWSRSGSLKKVAESILRLENV